jgi:hypothetical protein
MTVKELLCHPNRWCQRRAAYNAQGKPCDPTADEAIQWSLDGAIARCYENTYYEHNSNQVYQRVASHPKVMQFVSWWNDDRYRTYEEVMELVTELDI